MDKLIVKGVPPMDGEYEFHLAGLLSEGHPDSFTNRELHRIKVMSGVRAGELEDAFVAGDNDVYVAIAAVVLTRAGKRVDEDRLWDAPAGAGLAFTVGDVEEAEDERPPAPAPPPSEQTEQPVTSGGGSSETTSASQGNGRSLIGAPDSERFAAYDRPTSVT